MLARFSAVTPPEPLAHVRCGEWSKRRSTRGQLTTRSPFESVTFPVSVGKMDWRTPMGQTQIINKITLPYWHPPPSVLKEHAENGDPLPKVVPPGRDNPLGDYAMRLAIHPGDYLIHARLHSPVPGGHRGTL